MIERNNKNGANDLNQVQMNFDMIMGIINEDTEGTAFEILDQNGILKNVLPYTEELKTIGKCKYHVEDAFTHMNTVYKVFKQVQHGEIIIKNLKLEQLNKSIQKYKMYDLLAFSAFVHDIGKYKSYKNENGRVSFVNHEIIGEEIVKELLRKFNVSEDAEQLICSIVKAHMYPLKLFKVRSEINKYSELLEEFIKSYYEYRMYILVVSFCDIWATSIYYDPENEAKYYKKFIEELLIKVLNCGI